jgi:integrase
MVVRKALVRAGLGEDPTVTPLSVRNTAGRRVYDERGLEAAAAFLGHQDLMSVAREIGVREHRPTRQR